MEKKNTVLLTVIAVATLLVAVVGATFAYFTATTTPTGNGGNVDATTTTVSGVNLTMAPVDGYTALLYPGGYGYAGTKVSIAKAETTDTKEYNVSYKLKLSLKNETTTAVTWTLYRANSATAIENAKTCTVNTDAPSAGDVTGAVYYQYECTGTNNYGTQVQTGSIAAGTATATELITDDSQTQATDAQADVHYYIVVDYPNNGDQNNDQGKAISASIAGVDSVSQAAKA